MAKINPITLRLGYNNFWKSSWYASDKNYGIYTHEDIQIRDYFDKVCYNLGLIPANVEIYRFYDNDNNKRLHINVKSFRSFEMKSDSILGAGLYFKNNPKHIKNFENFIKSFNYFENIFKKDIINISNNSYDNYTISFKINKHLNWNKSANLIAKFIGSRFKQNNNFKQILNKVINYIIKTHPTFNNIKGIKIEGLGRLNKRMPRATKISQTWGSIPLNTIDDNIDFATEAVNTKYGVINIKVWISYK